MTPAGVLEMIASSELSTIAARSRCSSVTVVLGRDISVRGFLIFAHFNAHEVKDLISAYRPIQGASSDTPWRMVTRSPRTEVRAWTWRDCRAASQKGRIKSSCFMCWALISLLTLHGLTPSDGVREGIRLDLVSPPQGCSHGGARPHWNSGRTGTARVACSSGGMARHLGGHIGERSGDPNRRAVEPELVDAVHGRMHPRIR